MKIHRFLDWLFRLEEINGRGMCPTYLYRRTLFRVPFTSIACYLHHFVGDDWSRDLHDHPKRFISLGLKGSYIEVTPAPDGSQIETTFKAPWLRSFPASHVHRILVGPTGHCWTLVLALWTVRKWGFWHKGTWMPFRDYIDSPVAEERKAC